MILCPPTRYCYMHNTCARITFPKKTLRAATLNRIDKQPYRVKSIGSPTLPTHPEQNVHTGY